VKKTIPIIALLAITLAVYAASLRNGFVNWDDGVLIYHNPTVKEISSWSIREIFTTYDPELYIPLTLFTYQIETFFFGLNPTVYHATNLVLHALNAVLVWILCTILLTRPASPAGRKPALDGPGVHWMAFGAALLFAIHPLNTEAVAWVSARKDVLYAFFFLLSIIAYVRYRDEASEKLYWWSVALFFLALLAKPAALSMAPILIAIDWYRERVSLARSAQNAVEQARLLWPHLLLSILFGIVALNGKTVNLPQLSLWEYLLLAAKIAVFSLRQIVLPGHFSVLYEQHAPIVLASPGFALPVLLLLALTTGAILLRRRAPILMFCFAWYLLALVPSLFNFYKQSYVFYSSDRYAYAASIGVFLAILWIAWRLLQRIRPIATRGAVAALLLLAISVPLSLRAYGRSLDWKDTGSLFKSDTDAAHPSFISYGNLGAMYVSDGRTDEAIALLERSLAIREDIAKTHATLGNAYGKKSDYARGLVHLIRALELDPKKTEELEELRPLIEQFRRQMRNKG